MDFRSKAISWGHILLDFVFSAKFSEQLLLSGKTRDVYLQIGIKFIGRWCKSNILQRRKKCQIFNFMTCKLDVAGQNTRRPTARQENYCESKQAYFTYILDKAFRLQEFQAKLFSNEIKGAVFTEAAS